MRNLIPILLAVVVLSSGCDQDGYSCNSDGCYEDNDNPQYQTLEDCNSYCYDPDVLFEGYSCNSEGCYADNDNPEFETLLDCQSICDCDESIINCGDQILHEGYSYSTVQIGEQCWFSENCRYLPMVSPGIEGDFFTTDPLYYVWGYDGTDVEVAKSLANYETYGVLYNWFAVMSGGLCPCGWHVPTDGEFTQLTDFLGGEDVAGGKMKEVGYDHWNSPNEGATNSSGWTGLPGGYNHGFGFNTGFWYYDLRDAGYWWSSSITTGEQKLGRRIRKVSSVISQWDAHPGQGRAVRCVRD